MVQKKIKKNVKKRRHSFSLWIIVLVFAAATAIFSCYKVAMALMEYQAGEKAYEKMEAYVTPQEQPPQAEGNKQPKADEDTVGNDGPGIRVDFDSLKKINPDIIGWLHYPSLDISYPILKGEDNDYYLHHTVEKKKNFSGSIFMETKNSSQFTDSHTIIYGHNMKNGSMFGKLKRIRQLEMTEEDYKFWILTPGKNQLCRVFSAQEVESGGEAYTLFTGPCQEFRDWADKMSRTSVVDPGEKRCRIK